MPKKGDIKINQFVSFKPEKFSFYQLIVIN